MIVNGTIQARSKLFSKAIPITVLTMFPPSDVKAYIAPLKNGRYDGFIKLIPRLCVYGNIGPKKKPEITKNIGFFVSKNIIIRIASIEELSFTKFLVF